MTHKEENLPVCTVDKEALLRQQREKDQEGISLSTFKYRDLVSNEGFPAYKMNPESYIHNRFEYDLVIDGF